MEVISFTRASTIGPLIDFVEQGGGIAERVFKAAELPLQLCERPHALIPLRDQFKLVEYAARELGDDALSARLSTSIGAAGLGPYGKQFLSAPTLGEAIAQGNRIFASVLQSGTEMRLVIEKDLARWSYRVKDRAEVGRQKNEVLALGYMLDLLRHFMGSKWVPLRVELSGGKPDGKAFIETLFRCDIDTGELTSTIFPAELLELQNPTSHGSKEVQADERLTQLDAFRDCVEELVRLSLLDGRPQRAWTARRFDMSVRTFQRRLRDSGTSFAEVARHVIDQEATDLLKNSGLSVSEVAFELGYSDPAHFTRAFQAWHRVSPRDWRERHGVKRLKTSPV
ncbi:HTH-type transcriptional regulator AppY [Methyloligella halotolerans]|uniref:HTH-type transcriptional regulator AppY n=1 Tax=Methyloligella halotolerans TaxID=1177755 RepID=A0A1E2RYT2_9HYPH|nr:AraC family transcriptional regulator [Methyloligella halotolerans]ODA67371.1 HTH-type transcriptional regulator AppY [Methyloligella halotolerans]